MLVTDLGAPTMYQPGLFDGVGGESGEAQERGGPPGSTSTSLTATVEQINARGRGEVHFAAEGRAAIPWRMRRDALASAYTTRWRDLLVAW